MLKRQTPFITLCTLLVLVGGVVRAQNRDVNRRDRDGRTALMRAAADGRVDEVKGLIAAHANLDMKDPLGQTALARAATMGHSDIVRLLYHAGGGKAVGKDHETFIMAVNRGYPDVVKALLEAGANKETPVAYEYITRIKPYSGSLPPHTIFRGSDLHGHRLIIETTQACQTCEIIEKRSEDVCQTALTYSSLKGNLELVRVMLDAGASKVGCGETALEAATRGHHQDILDLLIPPTLRAKATAPPDPALAGSGAGIPVPPVPPGMREGVTAAFKDVSFNVVSSNGRNHFSASDGTGVVKNGADGIVAEGGLSNIEDAVLAIRGKIGSSFTYTAKNYAFADDAFPKTYPTTFASVELSSGNRWTVTDDKFYFVLALPDTSRPQLVVDLAESLARASLITLPTGVVSLWGYTIKAETSKGTVKFAHGKIVEAIDASYERMN